MKVSLISPPTVTDFEDPEVAESDAIRMIAEHAPVGILSLASVLEQRGVTPHITDMNRLYYEYLRSDCFRNKEGDFCGYVARGFEDLSFDVFGFSTICSSYPLTLRIAREVKRTHPDSTIILGGPQASVVDVETLMEFPSIDCIVRGEAEETLPLLIDALSAGGDLGSIPGLAFRKDGEVVRTPKAPLLLDLDRLPMPAFHLYPELKSCRYVPLELGRGCPFGCTFCSTNDFFRRRFRLKSPQKVLDEMRHIRATYGLITFDLIHDMFTVDRRRVVDFCETLIASGEEFYWNCSARTDCIDAELIALMSKAGCRGIFFGIETGSARLQKIVRKDLDLDESVKMIECADRHRITTAVSLITGFPDETMQDVTDTVNFFADSLRFDHAQPQLHLLAPLADTPLHTQYRDRLVFDDIISDMSYQGWRQAPIDREMIKAHPNIFPNFYAVPTPHLDRQYLKELRDFALNSSERFRWLVVALHQNFGNLRLVFDEFRAWYMTTPGKGPAPDTDSSRYYADYRFKDEFIEFARRRYAGDTSALSRAVSSIITYEVSLSASACDESAKSDQAAPDRPEAPAMLGPGVVPRLSEGTQITELELDYKRVLHCLRRKGQLRRLRPRPTTLVTRRLLDKRVDVVQLSSLSAQLLRLCDGVSDMKEISSRLATSGVQVSDISPEKVCMFGLELLRQEGFIVLTSPRPAG